MPNGNVDPWHALGNYRANDLSVVPILINGILRVLTIEARGHIYISLSINSTIILGTAHCADMEPQNVNDPDSLKNARDVIFQNIQKWIQEANGIQGRMEILCTKF